MAEVGGIAYGLTHCIGHCVWAWHLVLGFGLRPCSVKSTPVPDKINMSKNLHMSQKISNLV